MSIKFTGKDMCEGVFEDDHGRHCALGWMQKLFPDFDQRRECRKWFSAAAAKITKIPNRHKTSVATINDDYLTLAQSAECLNTAIARMGYEIVEVDE